MQNSLAPRCGGLTERDGCCLVEAFDNFRANGLPEPLRLEVSAGRRRTWSRFGSSSSVWTARVRIHVNDTFVRADGRCRQKRSRGYTLAGSAGTLQPAKACFSALSREAVSLMVE